MLINYTVLQTSVDQSLLLAGYCWACFILIFLPTNTLRRTRYLLHMYLSYWTVLLVSTNVCWTNKCVTKQEVKNKWLPSMGGIPKSWACELEFILQERVEAYLIKIQTCTTAFLNCLTCDLLTQCHQSHANHFLQQSEPIQQKTGK